MNNIERLFWLAGVVFLAFLSLNTNSKLNDLETVQANYQLSDSIKSSQILDLMQQINTSSERQYAKGFEQGRTQAMIASLNKESLFQYKDGYHAALDQINLEQATLLAEGE